MTIATRSKKKFVILGAPRYRHKGQVRISVFGNNATNLLMDSPKVPINCHAHGLFCVCFPSPCAP